MDYSHLLKPPLDVRFLFRPSRLTRSPYESPIHSHPFYEIAFVLNGQCDWVRPGQRRLTAMAGEGMIFPPGLKHGEIKRDTTPQKVAWIGFSTNGDRTPPGITKELCLKPLRFGTLFADARRILDIVELEFPHRNRPDAQLRMSLAMADLVILIHRAVETKPALPPIVDNPKVTHHIKMISAAAAYLESNCESPLKIRQIARYHSLSHNHFIVLFQEQFGMTPNKYLQECRLKKAKALMADPGRQMKEIAIMCGFKAAPWFNRWFKEQTGVTPCQFAQKLRRPGSK